MSTSFEAQHIWVLSIEACKHISLHCL